jgi:hypothetical protein
MTRSDPTATIDPRYGDPAATATPWSVGRRQLETAMAYFLTTVRPDGRPHVTTIAAVWLDDALHFATGVSERKARNLAENQHVVISSGSSAFEGLDVVLEGHAVRVTDPATLQRLADAYPPKYGDVFMFEVRDGVLWGGGTDDDTEGVAFAIEPTTGFGFGKSPFSQTKWTF